MFWAYVDGNVLAWLDDAMLTDLATVACSPGITASEFARDAACSLFDARRRLQRLPLVAIDDHGTVVAGPLLQPLMRACRPAELLRQAQALAAQRAHPPAMVTTLLLGGDLLGAARVAEESIATLPSLNPQSLQVLSALPDDILRSFPRLWLGVGMPRWWHDDPARLVESATAALETTARDDIETRFGLLLMLLGAWIGLGQRERAMSHVDALLADARSSPAPHHAVLALLLEALCRTFDEAEFDIEAVQAACSPMFANAGLYFVYLLMPLATWYRMHGNVDEVMETYDKAIALSQSLMPGSCADALSGATYMAWVAGAAERFDALREAHRATVERHDLHGAHGFFARAAAGDPDCDAHRGIVRPWALAQGLILRAAHRDAVHARRDLLEAVAIGKRIGFRTMAIEALCALAAFDDAGRIEHLRDASALADRVGTVALREAVDAMAMSDGRRARHFQPIVRAFAHLRPDVLRLSFQDRSLSLGDRAVPITRQQFDILAQIALAAAPLPRRLLGERISPNASLVPEAVLEVQLARLRKKLGSTVVLHDGAGYRFGVPFSTDWHEARRALTIVRETDDLRRTLASIAEYVGPILGDG